MKVEKEKFDSLLGKLLKQKPEKTSAIKGKPGNLEPIVQKEGPTGKQIRRRDSGVTPRVDPRG